MLCDREWQIDALQNCLQLNKPIMTVMASVGAGKTCFAAELASKFGVNVLVVTPFTSIFSGWKQELAEHGVQVTPGYDAHFRQKGYQGFIISYQALGSGALIFRAEVSRGNWLVIFDEIHHLGDDRSWGNNARVAFENIPGLRILGLTGTAWRTDGTPIPFVTYDVNGMIQTDVKYLYGEAVTDKVVRPIEFPAIDAEARIQGPQGYHTLRIEDAKNDKIPDVIRSALAGRSDWLIKALTMGELKRKEHASVLPNAAGIVFVFTQKAAIRIQEIMRDQLGIRAIVVVSEDPLSDDKIKQFCTSSDIWIIAVRKISEGVNIPRLTVAVFATNVRTELFFNQSSGRIVRRVYDSTTGAYLDDGITACMIIPAATPHVTYAKAIYDEMERGLREQKKDINIGGGNGPLGPQVFKPVLPATDAELKNVIHDGHDHDPDLLNLAQKMADETGGDKYQFYNILQKAGVRVSNPQPPPKPASVLADEEKALRQDINKLTQSRDFALGLTPGDTNYTLRVEGFPPRGQATLKQLEDMRNWLMKNS